jgi:RNA-directed DNA polymerase
MVRYADDFVIFTQNKEDIEALYDILNPYLNDRGLTLSKEKTKITHISEGFDFLGFNFRRYQTKDGYKHFSKPSKESIKGFKSKIADIFKTSHGNNVDELVKRLNPLIRGTANYWKPTVAKKIFSKMDTYIWHKVLKFVKRLHPKKPMKWIIKTYFPAYNDGKHKSKWVLTGSKEGNKLIKMVWTPIKRHFMIQFNHSHYDKSKKEYFNKRRFLH